MPEIRNLSFSYDGTPVFSGLCLSLPDGSRTALLAPSGFGKTTLLRTALRQSLPPRAGSITGIPGGGNRHVFQEDRLLPGCTVLENLRLVAPERPDIRTHCPAGRIWDCPAGKTPAPGSSRAECAAGQPLPGRWYSTARWSSWTSHSRGWTKPPCGDPRLCGPLAGGPYLPAGDPQPSGGGTPGLPDHPSGRAHPTSSEKQN